MTRKTTIETHEVYVVNPCGSLLQSYCERCGGNAGLLKVEEVALAGISLATICRKAETDNLHLIETTGGLVFMCLNSLLK
jgi:hypothetical protein